MPNTAEDINEALPASNDITEAPPAHKHVAEATPAHEVDNLNQWPLRTTPKDWTAFKQTAQTGSIWLICRLGSALV
ncbi:hypothetical protein AOLI_G00251550 [Acnodon oligacanthus]